jgi:hypothetical protein
VWRSMVRRVFFPRPESPRSESRKARRSPVSVLPWLRQTVIGVGAAIARIRRFPMYVRGSACASVACVRRNRLDDPYLVVVAVKRTRLRCLPASLSASAQVNRGHPDTLPRKLCTTAYRLSTVLISAPLTRPHDRGSTAAMHEPKRWDFICQSLTRDRAGTPPEGYRQRCCRPELPPGSTNTGSESGDDSMLRWIHCPAAT